jgi:hypothetical protein
MRPTWRYSEGDACSRMVSGMRSKNTALLAVMLPSSICQRAKDIGKLNPE